MGRVPVLLLNAAALAALAEELPAPRADVAAIVHPPMEPARPGVHA